VVNSRKPKMTDENELVIVWAGNLIGADCLKVLLENNGITVFLRDQALGMLAPWYADPGGIGAVKVTVPKSELEKAKPIIQKFLQRKTTK
jgi:hypothetical protein